MSSLICQALPFTISFFFHFLSILVQVPVASLMDDSLVSRLDSYRAEPNVGVKDIFNHYFSLITRDEANTTNAPLF
jgi:hypothetical protein